MSARFRSGVVALLLAASAAQPLSGAARCAELEARVAHLDAGQRRELARTGAYFDGEWLLVAERLVASCEERAAFAEFFGAAVNGHPVGRPLAATIRRREALVGRVLLAIWPIGDAVVPGSDGAFRETLPEILIRGELTADTVRPLLRRILTTEGVTSDVAFVLLTRPDRQLVSAVRAAGETALAQGDVSKYLFALAVLQRSGCTVRPAYEALLRRDLTPAQRRVVQQLLSRLAARERVVWDDVIDLEFS